MAGRGGPSFLKRQKEQARSARANAKRAQQQQRRDDRANGITRPEDDLGEPIVPGQFEDEARPEEPPADEPTA